MKDYDKMLSPCSHCGSVTMRELHTVHKKNGSVMYFGRCGCGCKTHPYMSPERAIDAWNAKFDKAKSKEGEINLAMREGRHEVSGKQETSAAIIAEMRGARTEFPFVYLMGEPDTPEVIDCRTKKIIEPRKMNIRRVTVKELADRLEAALKREVDKLNSAIQATVGRSDAEIDRLRREIAELKRAGNAAQGRELSKNASKNGADFGQLGNAAKLREALKQVNELNDLWFDTFTLPDGATSIHDEIEDVISAALAAPPRNCDVGSAVEQKKRFVEYCKGHRIKIAGHADVCNPKCPCRKDGDLNLCVLAWAQLPYEAKEGGNNVV